MRTDSKIIDLDELEAILNRSVGAVAEASIAAESAEAAGKMSEYEEPEWQYHPEFVGVEFRDVDAGWLFQLPGLLSLEVRQYRGFEDTCPIPVPKQITPYALNEDMIKALVLSSTTDLKSMFIGETGCGKTSGIEQFAAITGRPFHRQEFDAFTDDQKLFGSLELKDGETYFNKSDYIISMRYPAIVCNDEMCRGSSMATMALNPVLDRGQVRVTSHDDSLSETITAHPEWMVVATDNTAGNGDDIDVYNSANVLDQAIINRFDMFINVPYPSESTERELISAMSPSLAQEDVKKLAKFSSLCHKGFTDRTITTAFSIRNLKAITSLLGKGVSLKEAMNMNYVTRVAKSEKADIKEMISSIWR